MRRRDFIAHGAAVAGGLLAGTAQATGLPPSTFLLDGVRDDLARLRLVDGRQGGRAVVGPALRHADHLARMLAQTAPGSPLRRRVAAGTADAAFFAGWVAIGQGAPDAALRWYAAATHAGQIAGNPDLVALGFQDQARALTRMGRVDQALAAFDRLPVRGVTPTTRSYVEMERALTLAYAGRTTPVHRALDAAADALAKSSPGEAPPWLWVVSPNRLDLLVRGRCYNALGHGAEAYDLLGRALRQHPKELYRGTGTIHLEMAAAAVTNGDVDAACDHATRAEHVFRATNSTARTRLVLGFRKRLDPYTDSSGVRALDERLGAGRPTAYVRSPSTTAGGGRQRLHRADCPALRHATRTQPWPAGEGRTVDDLAADPVVRASYLPCRHCIGQRW